MACPASADVATGDLVQATDHNTLRCDALTHQHCGNIGSTTFSGASTFTAAGAALTVNNNARVNGLLFIGDCANGNMTAGITVNQGAADNHALTLKSSDVAHGLTSGSQVQGIETDDYLVIAKGDSAGGGVAIIATAEDACISRSVRFVAQGGTANTTKTAAGAIALVCIEVYEHNGANSVSNITANGNVFGVRARVGCATPMRMMVDEDGDLYSVTAAQTFDCYCDWALLEAYDQARAGTLKENIRAEYGQWTEYNEATLLEAGILGAPIAEGGMTNTTQLLRAVVGAVRQLKEETRTLKTELRKLNG